VRAAVIGAGAMGGALAAEAAEAGHDVVVIDVLPNVLEHIRNHGLRVETADGRITTRVDAAAPGAPLAEAVDIVVVFVKAAGTATAARTAAQLCGPQTAVVTLQNGWGNADVLAGHVDPRQVVVGVTYNSCTAISLGVVKHSGRGETFVGPYRAGGDPTAAERVAAFLNSAGWSAVATPAAIAEVWKKLVLNAATLPVAALSRLSAGGVAAFPPLLAVVDALTAEAVAVAQAQGHDIDIEERTKTIHAVLQGAGAGKPSMLQDVEAERRTEIATVNSAIVAAAAEYDIAVPLNQAMVALVSGLERSWAP
jgi:2-dehydropantoate 2-reductase